MDEKIDRRVIKTKERIRKVFFELLEERPLNTITVKELSERADINRATFYLHYKDVFDLMDQLEHDVIVRFENICEGLTISFTDDEFIAVFMRLMEFIRDNKTFCGVHIGPNSDRSFFEKLVKVVTDRCFDRTQYTTYGFAFVLAGIAGVILEWIFADMHEDPRTVAENTLTIVRKLKA